MVVKIKLPSTRGMRIFIWNSPLKFFSCGMVAREMSEAGNKWVNIRFPYTSDVSCLYKINSQTTCKMHAS